MVSVVFPCPTSTPSSSGNSTSFFLFFWVFVIGHVHSTSIFIFNSQVWLVMMSHWLHWQQCDPILVIQSPDSLFDHRDWFKDKGEILGAGRATLLELPCLWERTQELLVTIAITCLRIKATEYSVESKADGLWEGRRERKREERLVEGLKD